MTEAWANTLIGYFISIGVQLVTFPVFGIHIALWQDFAIGMVFLVASVVRSYTLRRAFNLWHMKGS
jgi:hypothetical protein